MRGARRNFRVVAYCCALITAFLLGVWIDSPTYMYFDTCNTIERGRTTISNNPTPYTPTVDITNVRDMGRKTVYKNHTQWKNSTDSKKCPFHKLEANSLKRYVLVPGYIGRLGNWIFQIASTIGIADVLKAKPVIESSHPILKVFHIDPMYISKFKLTNVVLLKERDFKNYSLGGGGGGVIFPGITCLFKDISSPGGTFPQ